MGQRCTDHSGYGSNGFQHNGAMAVALGEKGVGAEAEGLGEAIGQAIAQAARLVVDVEVDDGNSCTGCHDTAPSRKGAQITYPEYRYFAVLNMSKRYMYYECSFSTVSQEPCRCA